MRVSRKSITSGAKARMYFQRFTARLEVVPFPNRGASSFFHSLFSRAAQSQSIRGLELLRERAVYSFTIRWRLISPFISA